MKSYWGRVGALLGAAAVCTGAFGAHGLKAKAEAGKLDPKFLKAWETAAHYHLLHAILLTATADTGSLSDRSALLFLSGIALFSGSLYAMTLTQNRAFGPITPIGGLTLIAGWLSLAGVF